MLRTVPKSSKSTAPDEGSIASANGATANRVFISTEEVRFTTAAAIHRRRSVSGLLHSVIHIHHHPHEPHPSCLHIEPSYFETARMARHMTHL